MVNKFDDICLIFSGPTTATTPLEAETRALIFLLSKINNYMASNPRMIVLTDSLDLVNNVRHYKTGIDYTIPYTEEHDMLGIHKIHLEHTNRSNNLGADSLAKQGLIRPNIIWGH